MYEENVILMNDIKLRQLFLYIPHLPLFKHCFQFLAIRIKQPAILFYCLNCRPWSLL